MRPGDPGRPGSPFGGGRLQFGPGGPMPVIVRNLLIANLVVFLLPLLPGIDASVIQRTFGLVPAEVFAQGKLWQLVTYTFVHGGVTHIFLNMLILWMFGTTVERQWGAQPFLYYYLICGVGGAVLTWIMGPSSPVETIGASGANMGVLVAYAMMFPDRHVFIIPIPIPVKVKYLIWFLVAVDLFSALSGSEAGIAHFAHLGGALAGFLYLKQDWRLGSFGRKVRGARARQKMKAHAARTEQTHEARSDRTREINRILEKISREGMDSLTPEELEILRDASKH